MKEIMQLIRGMLTGQPLRMESGIANLARKVTVCFQMGTESTETQVSGDVIQGEGKQWPCCACQAASAASPALLSPWSPPMQWPVESSSQGVPSFSDSCNDPEMH